MLPIDLYEQIMNLFSNLPGRHDYVPVEGRFESFCLLDLASNLRWSRHFPFFVQLTLSGT